MVPFGAGQAEEPLFENRVAIVLERHREAQTPLTVADDAELIDTTNLSIPQAISRVLELVERRRSGAGS